MSSACGEPPDSGVKASAKAPGAVMSMPISAAASAASTAR